MKIVYTGKTKTGKDIIIRYPDKADVREMARFINELSDEKTFVTYQGEHETIKSETKFLNEKLQSIKNKNGIFLLVYFNNKLVATSGIDMMKKTAKHVGIFGISVAKNYRNEGIGKILLDNTFKEAKKEMPQLKIVALEVYAKNSIAKRIYEGFGFRQYGLLPNGIVRDDIFEDAILMYKNV